MKALSFEDKQNICNEYKSGVSIKTLYQKYNVGDRRIKNILTENNIIINDSHKKISSNDDYIEKNIQRFPFHIGYKYLARLISDHNICFDDYLNKSGILISYIKNKLNIEIPSLFLRKKFFHLNNKQWYENYFEIIEIPINDIKKKKCPYCNWETIDTENKSGMFETHLLKEHSMTKFEYLQEFPEDREYFSLSNKTLDRQLETNEKKFVCCLICGKKYARIDWRHLSKHGISKQEYINKYCKETISSELKDKLSNNAILLNKNIKSSYKSKPEIEISNMLKTFGVECINNDRVQLNGRELDIYIPKYKIAIEYNGNFWHNEKYIDRYKHFNKMIECQKKGIKLIQIFEDEYINKKEIVLNKIKHILGISNSNNKIFGRKCLISEIDSSSAKYFLNKYHIQGFVSSSIYLGAFYNGELVAVMTFKKEPNNSLDFELNRFASNYNYVCCGVGGKLFSYFIKNYNPNIIKSFADRRWTINEDNNLYIQLGFKFDKYIRPDYRYYNQNVDKYNRFHKFNFRKQILHKKYGLPLTMTEDEMTKQLGYYKIWDCGLIKYVWRK